jgi:hypothetical protein
MRSKCTLQSRASIDVPNARAIVKPFSRIPLRRLVVHVFACAVAMTDLARCHRFEYIDCTWVSRTGLGA